MRAFAWMRSGLPLAAMLALWWSPIASSALVTTQTLDQLRVAKASGAEKLVLRGLVLQGSEEVTLDLERFEVFRPLFQLVVDGVPRAEGAGRPDTAYFRGTVQGDPGSLTMLAIGETVRGFVQTSCGTYLVAPEKDATRGKPTAAIHVFPVEGLPTAGEAFRCGAEGPGRGFPASGASPASPNWIGVRNVEVAIETDNALYLQQGGEAQLLEYVGFLGAFASAIYLRDLQTTIQIPYVSVWSGEDPWGTIVSSEDGLAKLGDYWHFYRLHVQRATTHMLSAGFTQKAGTAYIAKLCAADSVVPIAGGSHWGGGYGFNGGISGSFSTINPGGYWDLLEFTHELGHNFGSPHTHCYNPPVDFCSSECYPGQTTVPPGGGTIMGYCHLLAPGGFANVNLSLGVRGQPSQAVLDTMRGYVESVACACQPPFPPALAAPANGSAGITSGYLEWEDPSVTGWSPPSGVTAYEVYLDTVNPPEKRISRSGVRTSMAIPTWFPNTTYYWKVVAQNGCGSASSPVYTFSTGAACSFVATPPALSATVYGSKALLTWSPVAGAAHYTVYLETANPPSRAFPAVYAPQTQLEVTIAPGTTYYWRVKATPGCGNSAAVLSDVSAFSTGAAAPALTAVSPDSLNRWDGWVTLFAAGSGLSNNTLLTVSLGDRSAGTFSFGGASGTSMSGSMAMDPSAPAGWYDAGLTNYGFENQRLPLAVAVKAFTDVPVDHFYFMSSSRVVDAGIMEADMDFTAPGPQFSPTTVVTREFMAEYLAKAYQWWRTGTTTVPAATCVPSGAGSTDFPDVPCSHPRWLYIHWVKAWGVTVGSPCDLGVCYLPNATVDRSQMVTFLLRLKYGTTLPSLLSNFGSRDPGCAQQWPACVGWSDPGLQVPTTTWPHGEVNVAYSDRLSNGCAAGNPPTFCAFDPVSRGQMVEFLARIVNLVPNP